MYIKEVLSPAAEQCSQESDVSHYDHCVRDDQSTDEQTIRDVGEEGSACGSRIHATHCKCVCKYIREDEEDSMQRGEEQPEGGGYKYCSDSVPNREKVGCQSGQKDEGKSIPVEVVSDVDYSNYGHLDQYGQYIPRGAYAFHKPIQYQRRYRDPITGEPKCDKLEINNKTRAMMRNREPLNNRL